EPKNFDGGTQAGAFKAEYTFNGTPVKVDKDLPYGTLFGVNKSHLFWVPEVEGEWADDDGTVLFRVQNKDNYEAGIACTRISSRTKAMLTSDSTVSLRRFRAAFTLTKP